MARARNIKPGFFANPELVELPFSTRLLFIGLWTVADRAGRLEDRPKKIKMAIFPADDVDIDAGLDELQAAGMLVRYEVSGERYISIVSFGLHQHPHKDEKASTIPAPGEHGASTRQAPTEQGGNPPRYGLSDSPISDSPIADTPPSPSAQVCLRLKAAGMQAVNPGDPRLLALLEAGLTPDEIVAAGAEAVQKGKPFAYALKVAEGRRRDAATAPLPDKRSATVPPAANAGAALEKIKADAMKAAPIPSNLREQISSITGKLTGAH